ncbi:MAG: hypothetical protein GYA85_00805 [Propionibacterium sp.]|nr:hypothetical protein [Propionibacterium sp.]
MDLPTRIGDEPARTDAPAFADRRSTRLSLAAGQPVVRGVNRSPAGTFALPRPCSFTGTFGVFCTDGFQLAACAANGATPSIDHANTIASTTAGTLNQRGVVDITGVLSGRGFRELSGGGYQPLTWR